ncbi:TPA: hypothetical protein QIB30_001580 [Klebsiella variicola]|nr:hypothetical protein [Klebsiella variicola]
MWVAGWGAGKVVAPAIGKYLTEIGILSQKGVPSYIRSAQVGLGKPGEVDVYKNQMRNNTFPLEPKNGIIAGYTDKKGVCYVSDGNHRMVAAVEYYNETGDPKFINLLIKNGSWTYDANYMDTSKPLPIRK